MSLLILASLLPKYMAQDYILDVYVQPGRINWGRGVGQDIEGSKSPL